MEKKESTTKKEFAFFDSDDAKPKRSAGDEAKSLEKGPETKIVDY